MARTRTATIERRIEDIVADYSSDKRGQYELAANRLIEDLAQDAVLSRFIHSTKYRAKDPEHLEAKLHRKADEFNEKKEPFPFTVENYEDLIEDLGGCRLLHIHTKQMAEIHPRIKEVLSKLKYILSASPVSYTWDIENEKLFKGLGATVVVRDSFYTSTHYSVKVHGMAKKCELQVRTLAEELWGEVSHSINYPNETNSIACAEQLLALARFSSGCSRLVDSLFASRDEYNQLKENL